jgi:type III pantothenate kinase
LEPSRVIDNADLQAGMQDFLSGLAGADALPALIASVNPKTTEAVVRALRQGGVDRIERFGLGGGADLPIPIEDALEDRTTVGQDRLLAALGAWWRTRQACIVIDAGTAVTVDFIDGAGIFQGGAIAPGVRMMLRAMHEQTAALPETDIKADLPSPAEPFGKTTRKAMALGAASAARGLARYLIDRYAEYYEAYPTVVATGGDAPMLFEDDPLIERIVPDLQLVGMLAAVERLAQPAEDDEQ